MSKSNGQADIRIEEQPVQAGEVHEPELPPADPTDGFIETAGSAQETVSVDPPVQADPPVRDPEELLKLRQERDTLFDRLARLQAEFDNYRKRAARENAEFRDYAMADPAKSLIPVMDDFSLALKNAGANAEDFKKGVELIHKRIHKQLQDVLQKMNVQRIDAQGQPFDPRLHDAIEMVESNEVQDNHVLEELQPGYRMKERLLRPAMVRVAKNTKQ